METHLGSNKREVFVRKINSCSLRLFSKGTTVKSLHKIDFLKKQQEAEKFQLNSIGIYI